MGLSRTVTPSRPDAARPIAAGWHGKRRAVGLRVQLGICLPRGGDATVTRRHGPLPPNARTQKNMVKNTKTHMGRERAEAPSCNSRPRRRKNKGQTFPATSRPTVSFGYRSPRCTGSGAHKRGGLGVWAGHTFARATLAAGVSPARRKPLLQRCHPNTAMRFAITLDTPRSRTSRSYPIPRVRERRRSSAAPLRSAHRGGGGRAAGRAASR